MPRTLVSASQLGKIIRETRLKQNITLRELSRRSGVDAANLSKYERGEITLGPKTAKKLLKPLGVKVDGGYWVMLDGKF